MVERQQRKRQRVNFTALDIECEAYPGTPQTHAQHVAVLRAIWPPGMASSPSRWMSRPGPSAEAVAESALAEVTRAGCYHGQQGVDW